MPGMCDCQSGLDVSNNSSRRIFPAVGNFCLAAVFRSCQH